MRGERCERQARSDAPSVHTEERIDFYCVPSTLSWDLITVVSRHKRGKTPSCVTVFLEAC